MRYYLSLGSNLGEREQTLRDALQQIEQRIGHVVRCSSLYYSEPWGFESEHAFCNLCCAVETDRTPLDVLRLTQAVERDMGRTVKSGDGRYHDRIIDVDIIRALDDGGNELHVNYRFSSGSLLIPHPLWRQRPFVYVPMSEI